MFAVWAFGCQERNPAFRGPQSGGAGKDGSVDRAGTGGIPGTGGTSGSGGRDAGPDVRPTADGRPDQAGPDLPANDGPRDVAAGESPLRDGGLGDGPAEAGGERDVPARDVALDVGAPDGSGEGGGLSEVAVDQAPACTEGAQQQCASPGNPQVGACHAGVRMCMNGTWGPCSEVLPAPQETCNNGVDDNCNGMVDEGCATGCLVVCATCAAADGGAADGSVERPFATLAAAIAAAGQSQSDGGTASRICVAGGASCSDAWTYTSDVPLTMSDGLIVQGGYAVTPTGLTYCDPALRPTTTLAFTSSQGVVFDQSVVSGAELSGFVVDVSPATATDPGVSTIGVAVAGGQNVSLSRIFIGDGLAGANTYGVSVTAGGRATVVSSAISSGQGRNAAVGVYVAGGAVTLRNNCDRVVAGNCASACGDAGTSLGIRGHVATGTLDTPVESSAVYITGSAGSTVAGNMICGGSSSRASATSEAVVAALRCEGTGCATVTGNQIAGGSDHASVGVSLVGANPMLDRNRIEGGCGTSSTTGVRLESSTARLQNNRIFGGTCVGNGGGLFYGVHVIAAASAANPDVHSNDIDPLGAGANCESIGVLLENSSGASSATGGVLRNNIIAAGTCARLLAVSDAPGPTFQLSALVNNDLYASTLAVAPANLVLYHHGNIDAVTSAQVNAQSAASGNISADPGFVAYPSDLHLTSHSPCVDEGTADGAPTTDADSNPRPIGPAYDIGAYELQN